MAEVQAGTFLLFDVDGTLVDSTANQRQVWSTWASRQGLDAAQVYRVALRTTPMETFAEVAGDLDPQQCLRVLNELEDEDVRSGVYAAYDGASELLSTLPASTWAVVTSNYEHRVRGRFARVGLTAPGVIVDAAAVTRGKPSPEPYLLAARRLGVAPQQCLVIEDAPSGVASGLSAGMTVWVVNNPVPVPGAHRQFASLRQAVPHIFSAAQSG